MDSGGAFLMNFASTTYVETDKAAGFLGLEPARFRFLETCCEDFLSASRLEFPRSYTSADLKILAAANRLHEQGLSPGALKAQLARMLVEPLGWNGGSGVACAPWLRPRD